MRGEPLISRKSDSLAEEHFLIVTLHSEEKPRCTAVRVNLAGSSLAARNLLLPVQKVLRTSQHPPSLEDLAETPQLGTVGARGSHHGAFLGRCLTVCSKPSQHQQGREGKGCSRTRAGR